MDSFYQDPLYDNWGAVPYREIVLFQIKSNQKGLYRVTEGEFEQEESKKWVCTLAHVCQYKMLLTTKLREVKIQSTIILKYAFHVVFSNYKPVFNQNDALKMQLKELLKCQHQ